MTRFKVLKCDNCNTLTYKRANHKTVRCPKCNQKFVGEPIKIFDSTRDAINFIKQEKIKYASQQGDLFESFG